MDELDRHRSLPYRRGAPLDRAAARVARSEHARQARLKKERIPRTFLSDAPFEHGALQCCSRQDEAALVEFYRPFEPVGVGLCPDKHE